jgi:hypothetical protein
MAAEPAHVVKRCPEGTRFGMHLCLGDFNHKAMGHMTDAPHQGVAPPPLGSSAARSTSRPPVAWRAGRASRGCGTRWTKGRDRQSTKGPPA